MFAANNLPPVVRHITLLALNLRFTRTERDAIRASRISDPDISDIMFLFETARYIDLDRAETIDSLQALEAKTLLDPGRANEILSAPIQFSEIP